MIAALVAVFSCASAPAWAQTALAGVVRDPSGYIISDAPVVVVEQTTGWRTDTKSGAYGYYIISNLPHGTYTVAVTIRLPGDRQTLTFQKADVTVVQGYLNAFDITLSVSSVESVTVQSETSALSTSVETAIDGTTTFSRQAIDAMPLTNGRTLQSMLSVVPGIIFTNSVGTLAQFTAAGQRRFSNRLTIDGVSADFAVNVSPGIDPAETGVLPAFATSGGTQTLVPDAAIGEIEVRTTNASPEYARAPGAMMSVVTRAGTDRFSALGFTEARPSQLMATDWFINAGLAPERETNLWDTGASFGGPLYPRRVFYFGTWQRQQIDRRIKDTIWVPSLGVREAASDDLRPFLDAYPRPNGRELGSGLAEFSDAFPAPSNLSVLSLRVDASLSRNHRLFGRVNGGESTGSVLAAGPQLPLTASFTHAESSATRTATIGLTSATSSTTHELRVNASRHEGSLIAGPAPYGGAEPLPLGSLVPARRSDAEIRGAIVPFGGVGGIMASGPSGSSVQDQFEVVDAWSLHRGAHEWRLGASYRATTVSNLGTADRYTYRFSNLNQFLQGQFASLTAEHFEPARARVHRWSVFAQDTLRLSPRLTVNYGLRYSVMPPPSSLTDLAPVLFRRDALPELDPFPAGTRLWRTSWTDIAPDVAATYQLRTSDLYQTNLRAAWTTVFDDGAGPGMAAFGDGPPYASRRTVGRSQFPLAPETLAAPPFASGDLVESYSLPQDGPSPRTYEWQINLDQSLGRSHRLGLGYVGAAGRHLPYRYVYYVDPAHPPTSRLHAFSNVGASDYHALLVEYVRRLSGRWRARVSYAWSHAMDNDSGEYAGPNPPPELMPPALNRASSDFDIRHVLHATGSYSIPTRRLPRFLQPLCADWQLDVVGMLRSGAAVSVTQPQILGEGAYPTLRPDLIPEVPLWIADEESPTGSRINTAAFAPPAEPGRGSLGRNTLRALGLRQVDLALSRPIRVGPQIVMRLRIEVFNVLNTPNFGPPGGRLDVTGFGLPDRSYADALGTGTLSLGGLAPVQQVGGPRSVQIGFRVTY